MKAKSRAVDGEKLSSNKRRLETLSVRTPVASQNQSGRYPNKWDKTGVIMEVKPHEQIVMKVDGSRRLTLRNRRFVRELDPGKASLRNPTPGRRRIRYHDETLPLWNPPPPEMILPPQPTPPETIDDLPSNTEMPAAEVTLPNQHDGEANQHIHGREDP